MYERVSDFFVVYHAVNEEADITRLFNPVILRRQHLLTGILCETGGQWETKGRTYTTCANSKQPGNYE